MSPLNKLFVRNNPNSCQNTYDQLGYSVLTGSKKLLLEGPGVPILTSFIFVLVGGICTLIFWLWALISKDRTKVWHDMVLNSKTNLTMLWTLMWGIPSLNFMSLTCHRYFTGAAVLYYLQHLHLTVPIQYLYTEFILTKPQGIAEFSALLTIQSGDLFYFGNVSFLRGLNVLRYTIILLVLISGLASGGIDFYYRYKIVDEINKLEKSGTDNSDCHIIELLGKYKAAANVAYYGLIVVAVLLFTIVAMRFRPAREGKECRQFRDFYRIAILSFTGRSIMSLAYSIVFNELSHTETFKDDAAYNVIYVVTTVLMLFSFAWLAKLRIEGLGENLSNPDTDLPDGSEVMFSPNGTGVRLIICGIPISI